MEMEEMPLCKVCNEALTEENWYESSRLINYYICKDCLKQRSLEYHRERVRIDPEYRKKRYENFKKWVRENRERFNSYHRKYSRKHLLNLNGKRIVVDKRLYPGMCEICGNSDKKLDYHHWDDDNPSNGVWICYKCHRVVEAFERGVLSEIIEKYMLLKVNIEVN